MDGRDRFTTGPANGRTRLPGHDKIARLRDSMSVILWIIVGLVAGWLANVLLGSRGGGLFYKLAVGLVGAIVGGFLFEKLNLHVMPDFWGNLITATIGAVIFLAIWRAIRRA